MSQKFHISNFIYLKILSIPVLLGVLTGCPNGPFTRPNIDFSQNTSDPSQITSSIDFGSVNATEFKTLEVVVRNNGLGFATLNSIQVSGGDFSLAENKDIKLAYPQCRVGMDLENKEHCSLLVSFAPQAVSSRSGQLKINYTKKAETETFSSQAALVGVGALNCNLHEDLLARFQEGASVGIERNTTEYTNGENSGLSRTRDDGYADGYIQTYQTNYDSAYSSAYTFAYNGSYDLGYNEGYGDTASCSNGSGLGALNGYADGTSVGYSNGYEDGYSEGEYQANFVGYNNGYDSGLPLGLSQGYFDGEQAGLNYAYENGYDIGYYDGNSVGYDEGYPVGADIGYEYGYADGANSCEKSSGRIHAKDIKKLAKKSVKLGADASLFLTACYDSGFSSTYNSNSFNNGYAQGLAANTEYQGGLGEGRTAGETAGDLEGHEAGQTAGLADGRRDGLIAGKDDIYEDCYNNAYEPAYTNGYYAGYESGDDDGYNDGYDDHYAAAYNEGYDFGYNDGYDYAYEDGYITGSGDSEIFDDGYSNGYTYGYNVGYDEAYDSGFNDYYSVGYADGQSDYCVFEKDKLAQNKKAPFIAKLYTHKLTKEDLSGKIAASLKTVQNTVRISGAIPQNLVAKPELKEHLDESAPLRAGGGQVSLPDGKKVDVKVFEQVKVPNSTLVRTLKLPAKKLPASVLRSSTIGGVSPLENLSDLNVPGSLRNFLKSSLIEKRFLAPSKLEGISDPTQTKASENLDQKKLELNDLFKKKRHDLSKKFKK